MKILIIKLAAAGDVLRTTSILLPLKSAYPAASISWVTSKTAKELLLNNPYLEKVYAIEDFKAQNSFNYDLIISLDEDEEAARLASNAGRNIVGFYFENGKVLPIETARNWFNIGALGEKPRNDLLKKENKKTYQEHMLDVIGLSNKGLSTVDYPLIYNLTEEEKMFTREFKKKNNISDFDVVIGFNTGAGERWQYKKWPLEKTCELILKTAKLPKVKLLLFGGPEEKSRNEGIVRRMGNIIIDTGTNNTLRDFGALVNCCDILLTSDSLAMHIGVALKKYVIVFFGPTSYAEIELYGRGKKIIPEMDCLVCYKQRCDFNPNCMDSISVDTMYGALSEAIKSLGRS